MDFQPKYFKLKEKLRKDIVNGVYRKDARIPSQNHLIKTENLSYSTVSRVLEELKREGYINRINGKGSFASDDWKKSEKETVFKIKLMIPSSVKDMVEDVGHSANPEMVQGIVEGCASYNLPMETVYFDENSDRFDDICKPDSGYILFNYKNKEKIIKYLKSRKLLYIAHVSMSHLHENINAVCVNIKKSYQLAVEKLILNGHRKIAFLYGLSFMDPYALPKLEGYKLALMNNNIPFDENMVFLSPQTLNECVNSVTNFFRKNSEKNITALLAVNDMRAIGALTALEKMNIKVPQDIAVIGSDNINQAQNSNPPLTTIEYPREPVGRWLVESLMLLKKNPDLAPFVKILETELIVRESFVPS